MIADLQPLPLSPESFRYMRTLMQREAAIVLEIGKEYLVETRLAGLAVKHGYASVNALVDELQTTDGFLTPLHHSAIDALTTNETLFFRDINPFDALRDHVIPAFRAKQPNSRFNIWSAASSTGQEAYSIAILCNEAFPDLPVTILGTDLSPTVVARARAGVYQQIEVNRGLPAKYLIKYFRQQEGQWHLDSRIKSRVDFREMNLARPWPALPKFDVIMLRNVMIYFDVDTRKRILRQVRSQLAPGGYLVLGGAETTVMVDAAFTPVPLGRATFYQVANG